MEFPKAEYSYLAHDNIKDFQNPAADYSPSYSWVWNDKITREGIIEQLDSMLRRGIRSMYILPEPKEFRPTTMPTYLEPDYLSPEYFELVRFAILEARKRGMCTWVYDEGGWPSGSANGLVMKYHPEFRAKQIDRTGNISFVPPRDPDYPGLLNPGATEAFLELTHEGYARVMGDDFAPTMPLSFTDEPSISSQHGYLPWVDGLDKRFMDKFGYDITEHLDALFDIEKTDDESLKIRADYHDLIAELFMERYYLPIRKWCRDHGILAAGHLSGDDVAAGSVKYSYHHALRCLRAHDVPGVDAIWRQVFPGPEEPGTERYAPRCANRMFPRYASSAAHQIGSRLSLTESYAIYGAGLTYDQMRWIFFFQAVRGINILNPMSMSYSYRGPMACSAGRPTYTEALPGAEDLAVFNDYIARACYLLSAGKPVADQALYMPFRDIWKDGELGIAAAEGFEQDGAALESRQVSFDVCDDDFIRAAKLVNGTLCAGDAAYRIIYLPRIATIPSDVQEKLAQFRAQGGIVEAVSESCFVDPLIITQNSNIRAMARKTAEGTLYFITNEAFEAQTAEISFLKETAPVAFELDLMTGERRVIGTAPYSADFAFGDARAILFPYAPINEKPAVEASYTGVIADIRKWSFAPTARMTVDADGYHKIQLSEPAYPIICGDWRCRTGAEFSGDAEYAAEFDAPEGLCGCVLDLGEVKYSCEVFLNGESVGKLIFTPFRIELPALAAHNKLVIRVSNTAANLMVTHDFARDYPECQRGPYDTIERQFETDSLRSGLYGPVRILAR